MLALIFATLTVIAPDGWVEDRDRAATSGAHEAGAFHLAGDPGTFYLVMRLAPDQLPDALIARAMDGLAPGITYEPRSSSSGALELVREHHDKTRTYIRVVVGPDPGSLVGICHGRDPALARCKTNLDTLNLRVDDPDPPNYLGQLALWALLGVVAVGLIGCLAIVLIQKHRLARSPKLVEGERLTISGVVQPTNAAVEAALSGRRCVLDRSRARVLVHDRLISEPREVQIRPFVVATRYGQVRIDVSELALEVPPNTVVDLATERQLAFRSRHDIPKTAALAFDEILIEPGSKVTIRGIVSLERDPDSTAERGYRDDAPTTIRLVGDASRPLTLLKIW